MPLKRKKTQTNLRVILKTPKRRRKSTARGSVAQAARWDESSEEVSPGQLKSQPRALLAASTTPHGEEQRRGQPAAARAVGKAAWEEREAQGEEPGSGRGAGLTLCCLTLLHSSLMLPGRGAREQPGGTATPLENKEQMQSTPQKTPALQRWAQVWKDAPAVAPGQWNVILVARLTEHSAKEQRGGGGQATGGLRTTTEQRDTGGGGGHRATVLFWAEMRNGLKVKLFSSS